MVKSVTCICFLFFFRNCTKVTNHLVHYTKSLLYNSQMILLDLFYNYKKVIVHYFNLSIFHSIKMTELNFVNMCIFCMGVRPALKKCLFGIATWGYLDPGGRKINIFLYFKTEVYYKVIINWWENKNLCIIFFYTFFLIKCYQWEVSQWSGRQFQTNKNSILALYMVKC